MKRGVRMGFTCSNRQCSSHRRVSERDSSVPSRGYLVLEDGVIQGVYPSLPETFARCPAEDYGDALILRSFADLHLHAPQ